MRSARKNDSSTIMGAVQWPCRARATASFTGASNAINVLNLNWVCGELTPLHTSLAGHRRDGFNPALCWVFLLGKQFFGRIRGMYA
jgi:hypothetical protein